MGNNGAKLARSDYGNNSNGWGKERKRDPSKKDDDMVSVKSVKLKDFQKTQTAPLLLDLLDEAYERRMVDVRSPTRRLEENPIPPLNPQPERSRFPEIKTNKSIGKLLNFVNFKQPEVLTAQCSSLMTHFENIRPILGFHTATGELLLSLEGPIEVNCRGEEYLAPIAVWLHIGFPVDPPSVYVTANGLILPHGHTHVTPQGEVLSPYLRDWDHNSTLTGLLDTLVNLFSHNPIFAVSSDSEGSQFTNDLDSDEVKNFDDYHVPDKDKLEEQLKEMFQYMNTSGDGKLIFDQFVNSWKELKLDPNANLHDVFTMLDPEKNSYISIETFISFAKSWENPRALVAKHNDFVRQAVHEFLIMTGLWPICENVLTKNRYDLQKAYDEFSTRGIGALMKTEVKEILQTLPERIELERLQAYERRIEELNHENSQLKERVSKLDQQRMLAETWYDGTEQTESGSSEARGSLRKHVNY